MSGERPSDSEPPGVAPRRVRLAVVRGFRGVCPACGEGRLFSGYVAQVDACARCGESFTAYRTADFAPYLVTFAIGLVFVPLTLVLSMSAYATLWLVAALCVAALTCALVLLPRAKGAAVGLLWALDVTSET